VDQQDQRHRYTQPRPQMDPELADRDAYQCPVCGDYNCLETAEYFFGAKWATQQLHCLNCGTRWENCFEWMGCNVWRVGEPYPYHQGSSS